MVGILSPQLCTAAVVGCYSAGMWAAVSFLALPRSVVAVPWRSSVMRALGSISLFMLLPEGRASRAVV
eukprot:1172277-Prymnesium_polylepis.5